MRSAAILDWHIWSVLKVSSARCMAGSTSFADDSKVCTAFFPTHSGWSGRTAGESIIERQSICSAVGPRKKGSRQPRRQRRYSAGRRVTAGHSLGTSDRWVEGCEVRALRREPEIYSGRARPGTWRVFRHSPTDWSLMSGSETTDTPSCAPSPSAAVLRREPVKSSFQPPACTPCTSCRIYCGHPNGAGDRS